MDLDLILIIALLLAALWTVLTIRLIRSVVGLALTSAMLSIIMFRLGSPMAAVFELSVCSGLISVIFITTISFTERVSKERLATRRKERFAKFWYLPVILVLVGFMLMRFSSPPALNLPVQSAPADVRHVLWSLRHLDLLGQIIVLLAGAFGIAILFKERVE
jgi:NADH-quinone oxidoreductase subunit J